MTAEPFRLDFRQLGARRHHGPASFRQHRFRERPFRNPALQGNPQQRGNRIAIRRKLIQPLDKRSGHGEHACPGIIEVDALEAGGNTCFHRQDEHAIAARQSRLGFTRSGKQTGRNDNQFVRRVHQPRKLARPGWAVALSDLPR